MTEPPINYPNIGLKTYHHGISTEITGHKVGYPTGSGIYSCKTPFTTGFKKNKTPIEKAQDKPTSLRLAINAKCYDCIGCGFDPKPTDAIRNCGIVDCPLWTVRAYQNKKPTTTLASGAGFNLSLQQNHEVKPL